MDDLVAFVEARLADDQRIAAACEDKVWTQDGASIVGEHPTDLIVDWVYDDAGWEHIAAHDPARVLRDVNAAQQMLRYVRGELADDETDQSALWLLQLLAAPYSAHPDFRSEWEVVDA